MAEPTVNVIFSDGSSGPIPQSRWAAAKKFDPKVRLAQQPLSGGQQATKFFADMAPALGGFTGSLVGGGAGAAASAPVGGELSVPGAIGGGALGGALGAVAQRGMYGLANIPQDNSIPAVASHIGLNAGWEGLMGGFGGVVDAAMRRAAPSVMKAAIGNAEPGAENLLLGEKLKPTTSALQQVKTLKNAAGAAGSESAAQAEAQGLSFPGGFQSLEDAVLGTLGKTRRGNVLGTEDEQAIEKALGVLRSKLGPQETTTPASKVLGPSGAPALPAKTTVTQAQPLLPTQLDDIYKTANEQVRKLFEARAGNKVTVPDASEKAWMAVRDAAGKMLDDGVDGFAKSNADYSKFSKAYQYIFNATKRSPNRAVTAAVGTAALLPGAIAHDPLMALGAVPTALFTHWAQSPEALSGLALQLNNPAFRVGARIPNKVAETLALRSLLGLGSPADATRSH